MSTIFEMTIVLKSRVVYKLQEHFYEHCMKTLVSQLPLVSIFRKVLATEATYQLKLLTSQVTR